MLATLVAKLVNLQVVQYEYFSARSDGNRLHVQYVPPKRGLIYDRSGTLLADNLPVYNLTIVPEEVIDLDATLEYLSGLVEFSAGDIETFEEQLRRSRVPYSSVPLRYVLTEEEKYRVAVNNHRMPGVSMEPQLMRHYPFDSLTAHSVGYVSHINQQELDALNETEFENYGGTTHIGKTGVERTTASAAWPCRLMKPWRKTLGQVMRVPWKVPWRSPYDISLISSSPANGRRRSAGITRRVVRSSPNRRILGEVRQPGSIRTCSLPASAANDYGALVTDEVNTPLFDRSTNPYPPVRPSAVPRTWGLPWGGGL